MLPLLSPPTLWVHPWADAPDGSRRVGTPTKPHVKGYNHHPHVRWEHTYSSCRVLGGGRTQLLPTVAEHLEAPLYMGLHVIRGYSDVP